MLTVTEAAAEAITALTGQEGAEDGGLRFAVQSTGSPEESAQLAVSVEAAPAAGDQVLGSEDGPKVFLEPDAAVLLDDKVLDIQQDEQGQVAFAVRPHVES